MAENVLFEVYWEAPNGEHHWYADLSEREARMLTVHLEWAHRAGKVRSWFVEKVERITFTGLVDMMKIELGPVPKEWLPGID